MACRCSFNRSLGGSPVSESHGERACYVHAAHFRIKSHNKTAASEGHLLQGVSAGGGEGARTNY